METLFRFNDILDGFMFFPLEAVRVLSLNISYVFSVLFYEVRKKRRVLVLFTFRTASRLFWNWGSCLIELSNRMLKC